MARLKPISVTVPTSANAPRPIPPITVSPNFTSSGPTAIPPIVSAFSLVEQRTVDQASHDVLRLPDDQRQEPGAGHRG